MESGKGIGGGGDGQPRECPAPSPSALYIKGGGADTPSEIDLPLSLSPSPHQPFLSFIFRTIFSATQSSANAQLHAGLILGISSHKIQIRVKRVGGAFGGKAGSQCGRARNPALVAANKLKRPVSCVMTRHEDMANTGGRHPAYGKYK